MNVLNAGNELVSQQQDRLERKFAVAKVEQVLKRGAEQIEDHGVVVTFCAIPANEGNADAASKTFVDTCLVLKLGVLGLDTFELDGDFFARNDVGSQVNVTETSAADLSADAVLVADAEILELVSIPT